MPYETPFKNPNFLIRNQFFHPGAHGKMPFHPHKARDTQKEDQIAIKKEKNKTQKGGENSPKNYTEKLTERGKESEFVLGELGIASDCAADLRNCFDSRVGRGDLGIRE